MNGKSFISMKPYLIRAIHEWIVDNDNTSYITVDTTISAVKVPNQYIKNNNITLDISSTATQKLFINNEAVSFVARFSGIIYEIYVPISAIVAIYSAENGQGMNFPKEEITSQFQTTKSNKIKLKVIPGGKV
ncbi:MAG: ClpXP protease specificity-enhancing factor [Coxiellaceae bacterium]|jgi:stringent starvation protein B|nr:ClpXP protease specificity-enhancing factor [Coxiellaceae bacterium]